MLSLIIGFMSPLTRGAWIETAGTAPAKLGISRPSHEGRGLKQNVLYVRMLFLLSPLTRGAWIETTIVDNFESVFSVAPHTRGVD